MSVRIESKPDHHSFAARLFHVRHGTNVRAARDKVNAVQALGAVSCLPLLLGPRLSKNGTAPLAQSAGEMYPAAEAPKQLRNISVLMMPGLNETAATPSGSSCASASVSPSTPHLLAQYGATAA